MTEEAGKTPEAPKAPMEIIRGRMPVGVVALVRFGANKDKSTKELAVMFGTTVGKIDDIKKNRNFAYVTADYRPSEQDKADAIQWLKRHPGGSPQALVEEVETMPVATTEQAAAFEAVRSKARGQNFKKKDGTEANAGGGNRKGKSKGGEATAAEVLA
jgi:hypothetical protein